MQIPKEAEQIIEQLNQAGFEAYVVGGCVRDTLLGKNPEDWDITTSARPEQTKEIFSRTIDTGIQHGTVTVMRGKTGYEVTTYRIDGDYEDGRHPKSVAFTPSLEEDLKRRDFTINAMAYNHQDGLVDIFGGEEDLKRHRIRCVGRAADRFREDALRMLRAVRFSAQLDFAIEDETREAVCSLASNLIQVSKERIQAELTKLLLSVHPEQIRLVYDLGLSPFISEDFQCVQAGDIMISATLPEKKALRWAGFLHPVSEEIAVRILKDLKMDNDTILKVRTLVHWWNIPMEADKTGIRRVMSRMTPELYDDLLLLKKSLNTQELQEVMALTDEIRKAGDCITIKTLAVNGEDLIAAGMKPGRALGAALEGLFQLVLEHPECNTKERLLKEIMS